MKGLTKLLRDSVERLGKRYEEVDPLREEVIKKCRDLLTIVRKGFGYAYRGDYGGLSETVSKATGIVEDILGSIEANREYREYLVRVAGDAMKEYVELLLLDRWLSGGGLDSSLLGRMEPTWIIEGVRDFAGEVRRFSLSWLIRGRCEDVYASIELLEELVAILSSYMVPSYIYSGYKKDLDFVKRMLDNLKSEYIDVCGGGR